jgi:hypothetical protein
MQERKVGKGHEFGTDPMGTRTSTRGDWIMDSMDPQTLTRTRSQNYS